jgi:hypothetical protein
MDALVCTRRHEYHPDKFSDVRIRVSLDKDLAESSQVTTLRREQTLTNPMMSGTVAKYLQCSCPKG